jgi:hypothetical protein
MATVQKDKKAKEESVAAGFEPAREFPNGFQVHRLNHSAKQPVLLLKIGSKNLYQPSPQKPIHFTFIETSKPQFSFSGQKGKSTNGKRGIGCCRVRTCAGISQWISSPSP